MEQPHCLTSHFVRADWPSVMYHIAAPGCGCLLLIIGIVPLGTLFSFLTSGWMWFLKHAAFVFCWPPTMCKNVVTLCNCKKYLLLPSAHCVEVVKQSCRLVSDMPTSSHVALCLLRNRTVFALLSTSCRYTSKLYQDAYNHYWLVAQTRISLMLFFTR